MRFFLCGNKLVLMFTAFCARQAYGCDFSSLLQGSDHHDSSTEAKGNLVLPHFTSGLKSIFCFTYYCTSINITLTKRLHCHLLDVEDDVI